MTDEEAPAATDATASSTAATESANGQVNVAETKNPGGYEDMARFMAKDSSYAIVRRFGYLNALNILYLQAELVDLEHSLGYWSTKDKSSTDRTRRNYQTSWFDFSRHETDADSTDKSQNQWNTMLRIRELLKQYNEAVIAQSQITRLTTPTEGDFALVQEWMRRPGLGFIQLHSPGQNVWRDCSYQDMIAFKARGFDTALSRFITKYAIRWYDRLIGRHFRAMHSDVFGADSRYYPDREVLKVVSMATMSLASLFPIVAIVVLTFVTSRFRRLGIIVGFTLAFSFCLGLFTAASKGEVFSASAAFAAVQVVFVGGDNSTSSTR